ncbi:MULTISPECIES: NAD(P)/FAD-dependent oxidoreductase [Nocardiopsis]|uniref:Amino acid dehydrogenase n=1 Tax=Nocardiopsis sinuspersici TaxID=501010 RepID=A0A1V3BX39_9ACTN|nr:MULTISPECIES: FAD-dependent oxidoreductase [Nocardiopsis]NYH54290.1 D-amino-acid dehydrogenase [Nocardiopsis sinuspersici]OOC53101.1 amino acid dehydrogenase [Nocardiopsis sinuspersici]
MADMGLDGHARRVLVVGAGIVGLSTAWFLQEHDVHVTVVDRDGVGSGSSWGNAGWLSPGLALPLNEPGVLRYGIRSLLDPAAPLSVPATLDPELWLFLARFAAHCRWGAWNRAVHANLPLNTACLDAFGLLAKGGVETTMVDAPVTALFRSPGAATGLVRELRRVTRSGLHVDHSALTGDQAREALPQASEHIGAAVRLDGQRYVDPGTLVRNLARSVLERGGEIRGGFEAVDVRAGGGTVVTTSAENEPLPADAVVVANGAWFGRLARALGVRTQVRAGRGYSFTVPTREPVPGPVYLPEARVACTPYQGALRVAGTMEFRPPDTAPDHRRVEAVATSARSYLSGVEWDGRTDEWVGPRPVTPDGVPLVGATRVPGVYVAGGHGMWGLTHGPVTGRLLAEQIATGERPEELRALDPLR